MDIDHDNRSERILAKIEEKTALTEDERFLLYSISYQLSENARGRLTYRELLANVKDMMEMVKHYGPRVNTLKILDDALEHAVNKNRGLCLLIYEESRIVGMKTLEGFRTRARECISREFKSEGIPALSDQREPGDSDRQYKGPSIF